MFEGLFMSMETTFMLYDSHNIFHIEFVNFAINSIVVCIVIDTLYYIIYLMDKSSALFNVALFY